MPVAFPLIESLDISGYQLYPGRDEESGISIDFEHGPWVVLGVNGLGKSTLLLIMKRLLTGPTMVRDAGFTGSGNELLAVDKRLFSARVGDQAAKATAKMRVKFGDKTLSIERRLDTLALSVAEFDGVSTSNKITDEEMYRSELASCMGLNRFEDALRVLDRIVFYLESRETLVWNTAAQFEIFRALLMPEKSGKIRALESEIISADSSARNLNAALFKLSERRRKEVAKHTNAAATAAKLEDAKAKLAKLQKEEEKLTLAIPQLDQEREDARRLRMKAASTEEDLLEKYEELKYDLLRHAFAGVPESDKYIFLKIISERICPTCGNEAEGAAKELEQRPAEGKCLVCGTPRDATDVSSTTKAVQNKVNRTFERLNEAKSVYRAAETNFEKAASDYAALKLEVSQIRDQINSAHREIRRLQGRLPAEARSQEEHFDDQIEALRKEVLAFRKEREEAELAISTLLGELSEAAVNIRLKLEQIFERRAKAFFSESVRLVYDPRKTRIGQGGRTFEFPAFEVELTSGSTAGEYVRRLAADVSLSQREYLDLIFRMSLVEALGSGMGTFVIDGPEGSVDAVFAKVAGQLFSDVSEEGVAVNVVLACNVVAGDFIPYTLGSFRSRGERERRVIDLTQLATPTAALIGRRDDYLEAVDAILDREIP